MGRGGRNPTISIKGETLSKLTAFLRRGRAPLPKGPADGTPAGSAKPIMALKNQMPDFVVGPVG